MFTYQIKVEYLGTNFVGWQIQKNGLSVQEVLEKALSKFLNNKISVMGSGRTDAGVHASEQSAHFRTKKNITNENIFLSSINFFLRKYPVAILSIKKRSKKFHARHSASKRIYLGAQTQDVQDSGDMSNENPPALGMDRVGGGQIRLKPAASGGAVYDSGHSIWGQTSNAFNRPAYYNTVDRK